MIRRGLWLCRSSPGNWGNRTIFYFRGLIVALYEPGGWAFGLRPGGGVDLGRLALLYRRSS